MKKILLFCAAAAALVLSASCNKGGNSSSSKVVLPAAQYTANAKKLIFQPQSDDKNPGIEFIEFTESGRYIICWLDEAVKAVDVQKRYECGTYTVNNGVYNLKNAAGSAVATINVTGNQVTIQTSDEILVITYTEEADKYPANEFYTTIARAWNVDKTDISVNFDGKSSVGVVKNGCDIPAILRELESKADVDLKDEEYAGYVVSEMNFTMSKTIEISFTGRPSVAGPISISENGSVSYELSGSNGVEVLSGSATGNFNLNPELGANQILLTLNTELTTKSGKTYQGHVSFVLSPKA